MSQRHSMSAVAGVATLLASMPLASVFDSWKWLVYAIVVIIIVIGTATLARMMHAPAGVQVLAMLAALLLILTWMFPSGGEIARLVPTLDTLRHFGELFVLSGDQVRGSAVPVPDLDGLLLLSTTGVGMVAVLVDLAAVGIRRPALAGLPMLAIYSVPVAVLPDGVSFLTFAAACAGYLWLLVSDSVDRVRRFGRRFSGEGRDVDLWEPSPLSAAGRRLGAVVIVLAILVPLVVPAMTSTIISRFGPAGGNGPGGGDSGQNPVTTVDMNAMLSDALTQDEAFQMVIVRTNDPSPYYLRFGVAQQLNEDGFYSTSLPDGGFPVDQLPDRTPAGPASVAGTYQAQVEVVGLSLNLAPVYTRLTGISGLDGNWELDENTEQVFSNQGNINGAIYTIQYARLSYSPQALRNAGSIPQTDAGARALTEVPESEYVDTLVDELTAGLNNQYDRVRALYDYFHTDNGFRYSLSTVDGESGSAIVDFLENKQGFCVQYAAALAWLVRQAGYPARVAFGFTRGGGGQNGVYPLTNLNLHAWTEVYFPGFGWVPFDATPGSSVTGSARTAWAPDVNDETSTPVLPTGPAATPTALPPGVNPGQENLPDGGGTDAPLMQISALNVAGAVAVVALLVVLLAPSLHRRSLRRRRRARTGAVIALTPPIPGQEDLVTEPAAMTAAQRDAHNAWAELLDTMIDYGVLVDPAETPRGTAGRLATTPELAPTGRPPAAVLARAEERARYAPAPVRATRLDEAVREARQAFADSATRMQQLSAWLFPRSVLMRWRLGYYGMVAKTARRVGRVRDAILLVELRERRHSAPKRKDRRR